MTRDGVRRHQRSIMRHLLFVAAIGVFAAAVAARPIDEVAPDESPRAQTPAAKSPAAPSPAPALQAGYVGSDTCLLCHDQEETLKNTAHGQAKNPRSPAAMHGCESCHGPGQAHIDDDAKGHIRKFSQIRPGETNETCLTCHNRGKHAGWEGSAHERRELACTSCHSVHAPVSSSYQLVKQTETQVCATCHRLQVVKTERAVAHMPVREGKMTCSSCHNPHGSISNVKALKNGSSIAESC